MKNYDNYLPELTWLNFGILNGPKSLEEFKLHGFQEMKLLQLLGQAADFKY